MNTCKLVGLMLGMLGLTMLLLMLLLLRFECLLGFDVKIMQNQKKCYSMVFNMLGHFVLILTLNPSKHSKGNNNSMEQQHFLS